MSNKKAVVEEPVMEKPWSPTIDEEVIFRHYDGVEEEGTVIDLPNETRRKYLVKLADGSEVPINLCYLVKK